jgi:uncharacterized protein YndB with AHSA1/START domain
MSVPQTEIAVRREVTVNATPERAFTVFAERFDTWWPRSHHIGAAEMQEAIIEPRAGGTWYEVGVDGSRTHWGDVLVYEPPQRLTLTWHINGNWQCEDAASEIDVTFTPVDGGTHVELVHRHLERHTAPEALRDAVSAEGGWETLLKRYSESVAG